MRGESFKPHSHAHATSDLELSDIASATSPSHTLNHATRPSDAHSAIPRSSSCDNSEVTQSLAFTPPPTDEPSPSLWSTLWTIIMSKTPLLIRSSPALGTGSYGALPPPSDDDSDDSLVQEHRTRNRRKSSPVRNTRATSEDGEALTRYRTSSSEYKRSSRRKRSLASEIGMGIDNKTSFTVQSPPLDDHSSGSSMHDSDTVEETFDPDNSPYPEVRASVPANDNTTLSINTPRMWFLSMFFAIAGSATNLFFSLRYPSVAITPVIALVLVHPLGRAWDFVLKRNSDPADTFINGDCQRQSSDMPRLTRLRLWLAQGDWNEKEHACVYISSNVSFGFAFATDVIVEQHKFYQQEVTIIYQLLLTISTQILGYAFAGLTRRYLVRPAAMIWPGTLMSTAMFNTMHTNENKTANGWTISRYRFFVYVWAGAFAWYFLPGLLMPALSYFSVITWFAPKNVVVSNLFGVSSGLGLFPLTFDWAQIAYIGSPLLTPWWAAANVIGGLALVMWIIAPLLYYSNTLFSAYLPILSSAVFDNTAKPYDVSKILTPDFLFDKEAYLRYSKVYLPITYVLSYGVQFAALSALVTHTICWHGKDIWRQSKEAYREKGEKTVGRGYEPVSQTDGSAVRQRQENTGEDIHCRLMRNYEDVPMWWYLLTFVAMLAIGIFVVEYYPVHLPWYGLLLALGITTVLFIPVSIVMAITNQHSSLYLICQLICGVVFPGRPVANMVFVTYCYISSAQGVKFSSDLKLGHYMKIPPKLLFKVQMVATLISSCVQITILNWMFVNIPGVCTPQAINGFNCPIARVHFNGSILWGVVGPQRFFGPDALYRHLVWAFLFGAIAPIVLWTICKYRRKSILRKVNLPVLFGSLSWIPPATGLNFSIWAVVCFSFNYLVRKRAFAWWGKYTMTMSAALDSGLAFSLVVIFFGFIYPGLTKNFKWWGTEIYKQNCDWQACPYLTLEPGEKFGP